MVVEISELIRQDVGIRHEVERCLAKPLLHADYVEAESVLARDLMALWEVVDLLILVQTFVLVGFACARAPKQVPLVRLRVRKSVVLQQTSDKLVLEANHFVKQLGIFDMEVLLVIGRWDLHRLDLLLGYIFEVDELRLVLVLIVVKAARGSVAGL